MPKPKKKSAKKIATKPEADHQAVVNRIQEIVVTPKDDNRVPLVTPLPVADVKGFGDLPFETQARLIFNTFPADASEIIGSTKNSGAGTVEMPRPAGT